MAHVARGRINIFLQRLGLNLECAREVFTNGHCFYDSIVAVAEDPRIRSTLSQDAQHILAGRSTLSKDARHIVRDFRIALANFMGTNVILHGLMWFEEYKRATLAGNRNKGKTWRKYLQEVAHTNEYADQLQVMCMALFCGKDIWQVSEESLPDNPWVVIPGQAEGWPYPARGPPIKLAYSHKGEHYEPLKHLSATPLLADVSPPSAQPQTQQARHTAATYASVAKANRVNQAAERNPPARVTRSSQPKLPTTQTKPTLTPPKQPAKRRGPSISAPRAVSQAKSPRVTPSKIDGQQEANVSQSESPIEEKIECKVCSKSFKMLHSHLKRSEACAAEYDMLTIEAEVRSRQRERKRAKSATYNRINREDINAAKKKHYAQNKEDINAAKKKHYAQNKEKINAAKKKHYAQHREEISAAMKKNYAQHREERKAKAKKYYQDNKESILKRMAVKRKAYFEKKTEYDRFMDFTRAMKNVCAYGCICCHRILSSTGQENKVPGGLKGLEAELKDLYKECILNEELLPPQLKNAQDIYLCSTCNKWLKECKKMPPKCYKNGLEVDPIPQNLRDLNELEEPLIARRIIFLKIFNLPVSRWYMNKDHSINVPIDMDQILNSLAAMTQFPRKPDEAGIIQVDLKRRKEYKHSHKSDYVQPKKLIKALEELVQLNNPHWRGIKIVDRYPVLASELDDVECSDPEDDDEILDSVQRNQLNIGGSTFMTDTDPTRDVITNLPDEESARVEDQRQSRVTVAPGEGKVPTSLTTDEHWDVMAFPKLYPTGRFGLHHPRNQSTGKNLTYQEFFEQRLCNVDPRWRDHKPFVFSALYCIERHSLEKAMNISYRRGKVGKDGKLTNLEDASCMFDSQPGSDRYWLKRRYEVLAKLEQLGPFQIFFTLSCADKRWDENFVAILQQRGLTIHHRPPKQKHDPSRKFSYQADDIFVEMENGDEKSLEDYLREEEDDKLHEMIRENILTITMIFDKRVREFINKIVMAPSNPMKVKYYHYRVEFQKRGAGHIHGVLWLDLDELEDKFPGLKSAMKKLKSQASLNKQEKSAIAAFVDSCSTCNLKDEDLIDTVNEVQRHRHKGNVEKKTGCYKKSKTCRFNFPRLPSEKTIIAQPLKQGEMSERKFGALKKEYKQILQRVKDTLVELTEDGRKECSLNTDELLQKAEVNKTKYYEALEVSQNAACIIMKRDPNEAYINNYNPEWLKAWDGNMDITVCLDYFAIITYITDYYTKTESGVTKAINAAMKASKERGDDMTATMRHLAHTFLKSREMGESEAYYRIFPHLHLSQSNIKCIFVNTGFPENRSTMVMPVKEKSTIPTKCDEDPDDELGEMAEEDYIQIAGSDKSFKRVTQIHDKYANRPKSLDCLCLAQFAISYDMMTKAEGKKKDYEEDGSSKEKSMREDMKIVSYNPNNEMPLPLYIKLSDDLGYMRLRDRAGQSVLRRYKIPEKKTHEYYYSMLQLFYPWRNESEDLCQFNLDKCQELFQSMDDHEMTHENHMQRSKIEITQEKLFPHLNDVEEGREAVAKLDNQRPTHIIDELDPECAVENEMAEEEGIEEDEKHTARFPSETLSKLTESQLPQASGTFSMIPLPKDDNEYAKLRADVRSLDDDQRTAFDIVFQEGWERRAGTQGHKQVLLIVQGRAGTGKTHLVNTMATSYEYFQRLGTNMSGTSYPAVIKLAPTGRASNLIDGLTLHKALRLPFGNKYKSLSDKEREVKRSDMRYLSLIIIDEMSMVKADQLYQIDQRLQDIKQSRQPFGGVSIVLSGDLLQLPPVRAAQVFEAPRDEKYREYHEMVNLWEMFKNVELTQNHRQAGDREYAFMLNRISMGEQTEEDINILASRISEESPSEALYIFGTNDPCKKHNDIYLEKLDGEMHIFKVLYPKNGTLARVCKNTGRVKPTSFLEELRLKVGAKVIIINNVDTSDYLSNGTCGYVAGFDWSRGNKPEITKILVQCEDPRAGAKERARHSKHPIYPDATPISRETYEYTIGDPERDHSAKAKLIQFPLDLASAMTCHKVQGMGLKPPKKLVADLDSIFNTYNKKTNKRDLPAPGMAYVMLGRVQNINQLILRWSYDPVPKKDPEEERERLIKNEKALKKISVNEEAKEEALKLQIRACNNPHNLKNNDWLCKKARLKIISLNVQGSLHSRLDDLKKDKSIMAGDIICTQETGTSRTRLDLEGYTYINAGSGKNKGVAVYIKDGFMKDVKEVPLKFENNFCQVLKVSCGPFDIINVYLANGQTSSSMKGFTDFMEKWITPKRPTMICGDFNIDEKVENELTRMLRMKFFKQIVSRPTTFRGYCIDHFYHNLSKASKKMDYHLHCVYYSDHGALCVTVNDA